MVCWMHPHAVPAPLPAAQLKAAKERPRTASQILDLPRPDWLIEGSVTMLSNGSLLQLFRTNRDRVYR